MNENTMWSIFWLSVALIIIVITSSTAIYNVHRNNSIKDAIAGGAAPLEVACAFDNIYMETCRDIIQVTTK